MTTAIRTQQRIAVVLVTIVTCALCACARAPSSPVEERVRALVERAETLAEAGDAQGFTALLSEKYSDSRSNSKQSAMLLLNHYISSHRSVHLLTRVAQVHLPDSSSADLLVLVAMSGRPIAGIDQLGSMRADLFHFFIYAAEERGQWKIRGSRWGRGWDVDGLEVEAARLPWRKKIDG